MNSKTLWQILVFVLILNSVNLLNARTAVDRNTNVEPTACSNPNEHQGVCISIFDCASLRYVLEHKLQSCYDFVKASECRSKVAGRSKKRSPFVCCTKDIRFLEKLSGRSRSDRIIFPDQLDRYRIVKFNKTENQTTTTISYIDKKTYPEQTNGTKITTDESQRLTKPKFPKPPNCGGFTFSNKIYGGMEADLGEFSWMVILEYRNLTTGELLMDCSGSIINERYVLTAAHCVQGDILKVNGKLESVRIGEHNTDTKRDCNEVTCRPAYRRLRIETVIPHADYKAKNEINARNPHDIALLRLEKPLKFDDDIQPACLPDLKHSKVLAADTKFTVSGWGHNGARARTPIKQKVELPIVKHEKCREIFSKKFFVTEGQLCAGGRFREDSCNGDSGGPLMRLCEEYWILEGLVSFGLGCGLERPGIYTNVRHYLHWIEEHVRSD